MFVSAAVEGITDEALLKRICAYAGVQIATVYGKNGKPALLDRVAGYNNSARHRHWVILVDLDGDAECAPTILPRWIPIPSALMCFRVAIHELEAWILSDKERVAEFFGISQARIPADPALLLDPKATLVSLARTSRKGDIREDLVPRIGSGQAVGPAYSSRLIEFLQDKGSGWRPEVAEANSESLRRCISALRNLVRLPYPPAP